MTPDYNYAGGAPHSVAAPAHAQIAHTVLLYPHTVLLLYRKGSPCHCTSHTSHLTPYSHPSTHQVSALLSDENAAVTIFAPTDTAISQVGVVQRAVC